MDEAGRGCLAGPIAAAAVAPDLGTERRGIWERIRDSKQLDKTVREELATAIRSGPCAWSVAMISALEVDEIGINPANRQVMEEAVSGLSVPVDALLVDWIGSWPLQVLPDRQERIAKGDSTHLSIAAASILAKVHRDNYMIAAAREYPQYGFESHKGYWTKSHVDALERHGPCPEHRFSFRPLSGVLFRSANGQ